MPMPSLPLMKTVKILAATAAALLLAACGPKTVIDGTLQDKADAPVIVKLLDVNKYQVLDTVKTDAAGAFSFKPELEKGCPEFIYLFYGDTRIAAYRAAGVRPEKIVGRLAASCGWADTSPWRRSRRCSRG